MARFYLAFVLVKLTRFLKLVCNESLNCSIEAFDIYIIESSAYSCRFYFMFFILHFSFNEQAMMKFLWSLSQDCVFYLPVLPLTTSLLKQEWTGQTHRTTAGKSSLIWLHFTMSKTWLSWRLLPLHILKALSGWAYTLIRTTGGGHWKRRVIMVKERQNSGCG